MQASVLAPVCATIFVTALVGTWLARRYALRRRLVDLPGERRSHVHATPRGGGIAIVAAVLPVLLWLAWAGSFGAMWLAAAVGFVMVAGIGWVDDHRSLSPWLRLGIHATAAATLAAGMAWAGQPLWWCLCICVLAVGLVNVWNFMDGIDGLATTQAMLVAIACGLLSGHVLPLAVLAACAGFLPFNTPRARIFLGDVGSGALGFLIACLFASLPAPDAAPATLLLLLPVSAFMIDAALTLGARMLRGERWWMPHVQHVYQRLVQHGASHMAATLGYAAWTFVAVGLLAILGRQAPAPIFGAVATWYLLTAATWLVLRVRLDRRTPPSRKRLDD
ncbi:lipopolysaccharide biosynthesis protein [Luteimonas deserti]|uniref:Lipopolysaccharide biosynthesis protein n=1 Tax=Luteimonas deserti TaxID=2752306 RepID=A0A7Z0QT54_9GAMM|nr:lipopolysaccharide biosynthesis protein [Luteimonas deserti]NYZ62973.1 lipopolysaccharide biosynthesis protein [Luteimonas deserti]